MHMKWLLILTVSVMLLAGCETLGLSEPTPAPTPIPTPTPVAFTADEAIGLVQSQLMQFCTNPSIYTSFGQYYEATENPDGTFTVTFGKDAVSLDPYEKTSEWIVFPHTRIVTTRNHIFNLC